MRRPGPCRAGKKGENLLMPSQWSVWGTATGWEPVTFFQGGLPQNSNKIVTSMGGWPRAVSWSPHIPSLSPGQMPMSSQRLATCQQTRDPEPTTPPDYLMGMSTSLTGSPAGRDGWGERPWEDETITVFSWVYPAETRLILLTFRGDERSVYSQKKKKSWLFACLSLWL